MDIIINETTLISDNIVWDNINNYINTNAYHYLYWKQCYSK